VGRKKKDYGSGREKEKYTEVEKGDKRSKREGHL
jgi:hypothetical protein